MQPQAIPQPTLTFTGLTIDETNTIFAALDELPQKRVRGITDKLIAQANQQLNPAPAQSAQGAQGAQGAAEPTQTPAGESGGTEVPAPGLSDPE